MVQNDNYWRYAKLSLYISNFLQSKLREKGMSTVTSIQAARWLDKANILTDSPHRPGKPLRELLRAGLIKGQRQEPNRRWYIDRVD